MNLLPLFETAVREMTTRQSSSLGDRNQYIGSSDVSGCELKSYLNRQNPTDPEVSTLLRFARGHAAEWMLSKIFDASGIPYDHQVEICHPEKPLKAHIDFLFYPGYSEMHVVEVKSVSGIPDMAYPQWEEQLNFQLGMVQNQYPVGKITGSVLAVDLNAGEVHQFNGYEHDDVVFNYLYNKGLHLLDVMNDAEIAQPSPSLLCGYCQYRKDCPAFASALVELPPEVEYMAMQYADLNSTKSHVEKEMKGIRAELLDFTGPSFKGRTESLSISSSTISSGVSVDAALLKQLFPDVYPQVLKPKTGYTRLEVKPFKVAHA
jgi:hypothetical protein